MTSASAKGGDWVTQMQTISFTICLSPAQTCEIAGKKAEISSGVICTSPPKLLRGWLEAREGDPLSLPEDGIEWSLRAVRRRLDRWRKEAETETTTTEGRKEGTEVERKWIHQCTRARGDRGERDTGPRDTKLS